MSSNLDDQIKVEQKPYCSLAAHARPVNHENVKNDAADKMEGQTNIIEVTEGMMSQMTKFPNTIPAKIESGTALPNELHSKSSHEPQWTDDQRLIIVDEKDLSFRRNKSDESNVTNSSVCSISDADGPPRKRYRKFSKMSIADGAVSPSSISGPAAIEAGIGSYVLPVQKSEPNNSKHNFGNDDLTAENVSCAKDGFTKAKMESNLQNVAGDADLAVSAEKSGVAKKESELIEIDLDQLTYYPAKPSTYDSMYGYMLPPTANNISPPSQVPSTGTIQTPGAYIVGKVSQDAADTHPTSSEVEEGRKRLVNRRRIVIDDAENW